MKIVASAKAGVAWQQGCPCSTPRPGEEIEVAITTTDPQGKPVAAELSLAMIEQSLLDRFREHLAPIQDFFQAERREPAVRTTSSITFAYNPATQPINPRLLAEEDRLELAAEEEASRRAGLGGAGDGPQNDRSRMSWASSRVDQPGGRGGENRRAPSGRSICRVSRSRPGDFAR